MSFHDLARAPALARAARTELYDRQHSGVIETNDGAIEFAAHAAEVERQHAAWQAVDADAKDEARVNKACSCLQLSPIYTLQTGTCQEPTVVVRDVKYKQLPGTPPYHKSRHGTQTK